MKGRKGRGPLDGAPLFGGRKAQSNELFKELCHRLRKIRVAHFARAVGVKVQRTLGGHRAVKLAQGACGRIAGIDKGLLAEGFLRVVQSQKVGLVHDHFAAHFQNRRGDFGVKRERNRADRAGVGSDVFAVFAVAARLSADKNAVFVAKVDRQTVELELGVVRDEGGSVLKAQFLSHALVKSVGTRIGKVRFRADREHGHGVADFREVASHFPAHTQRGRRARAQRGASGTEGLSST